MIKILQLYNQIQGSVLNTKETQTEELQVFTQVKKKTRETENDCAEEPIKTAWLLLYVLKIAFFSALTDSKAHEMFKHPSQKTYYFYTYFLLPYEMGGVEWLHSTAYEGVPQHGFN